MKTVGTVLAILGGLLFVSGVRVAMTKYDLADTNDLSKMLGALGVAAAIAAVGIGPHAAERKAQGSRLGSIGRRA